MHNIAEIERKSCPVAMLAVQKGQIHRQKVTLNHEPRTCERIQNSLKKKILMSKENGTQRYSYVSVISIYQFMLLKTNKDYLAKKIEI